MMSPPNHPNRDAEQPITPDELQLTPPPLKRSTSKRKNLIQLFVGAVAVLSIVLGFAIPGWQWLILIGAVLFCEAAFSVGAWLLERSNKGPGQNDFPPPPSGLVPM